MTTTETDSSTVTEATLSLGGTSWSFPVLEGTEGERGVDITSLRKRTGLVGHDPGFANTSACRSGITFIDGEGGILKYRGIPIEDVAEKGTFLEAAYLLMYGDLPTVDAHERFVTDITRHTMLHEDIKRFYAGFPKRAHPMAICSAVVGALSAFYPDHLDPETPDQRGAIVRLLAKLPTIAAYSYKHSIGQPFMYPRNDLGYVENFMHMMFATPCETYEADPAVIRALDILLVLHADHEQNCSTSTVRLVGSSRSNLFASISAGINALWGPLHGGANQRVIEMLDRIEAGGESVASFVARAKSGDTTARLMGFGHRVYKNYDPRARIIKKACDDVIDRIGTGSRTLDIARELEEIATHDEYFVSRKLYPNVDFYSGIIYRAIGIPVNMFTVLFSMGRLPGWIAHWLEMNRAPDFRIGRPRQIYTGPTDRSWIDIDKR